MVRREKCIFKIIECLIIMNIFSHALCATTEPVSSKLVMQDRTFLHLYFPLWLADRSFVLRRYVFLIDVSIYQYPFSLIYSHGPRFPQALQENVILKEIMCGDEAAAVRASLDCKYPVSFMNHLFDNYHLSMCLCLIFTYYL